MPLRNIKCIVEYDGTDFDGFQIQPAGTRTVQGEITDVLSQILDHPVKITGASRTDSGVHALGQVIAFKTSAARTLDEIKNGANGKSPGDWKFVELSEVEWKFNPRFDAVSKTYIYVIDKLDSVLRRRFSWGITGRLNYEWMREASRLFPGTRDFKSFTTMSANESEETVRKIYEVNCFDHNDLIVIEVKGASFLYQMVRRIVAAIVKVGKGEFDVNDISDLLENPRFDGVGSAAPAKGLILKEVKY